MNGFPFSIQRREQNGENRLGEPIFEFSELTKLEGYLDLMTGSDLPNDQNSFIEESSHIFITFDLTEEIKAEDVLKDEKTGLEYEITFVDNVMGLGHHFEIYCKRVA